MQKYILIGLSVLLVAFGCGGAKSDINHLVPRYQPIPKNLKEALSNLNDSWNAAKKMTLKTSLKQMQSLNYTSLPVYGSGIIGCVVTGLIAYISISKN